MAASLGIFGRFLALYLLSAGHLAPRLSNPFPPELILNFPTPLTHTILLTHPLVPKTRNLKPYLRHPNPQTPNPKPQTPNPKPQTLNPKPPARNPKP